MTHDEIVAAQERIGLPDAWQMGSGSEYSTKQIRHFLSGRTFHAELKGRISIEAADPGWIRIHTEAGPLMIKDQIIECDGSAL